MINAQWPTTTHYQTLGVSEKATQDEIKRSYHRLAKKYHPDRNKKKGAEDKFKEISAAYQVVGDPSRRQIYDYDLAQSRKAGAASASSSAGASSAPPPPHSSQSSSRTKNARAKTAPPPPRPSSPPPAAPAQNRAYRYLFFFRGALVGGGAVAIVAVLLLISYAACRKSPQAAFSVPTPPIQQQQPIPNVPTFSTPEPAPTIAEAAPLTREPIPTMPEPSLTSEPDFASTPTPTPEPHADAVEPTPAPDPVHLCGQWRGTFEWAGREIRFTMLLEQEGDAISGTWSETQGGRIWQATVNGRITSPTVILTKTYKDAASTVSFVGSAPSPDLLSGTWETPQSRGSWQAEREGGLVVMASEELWRARRPTPRAGRAWECWYGWRRLPDGTPEKCR